VFDKLITGTTLTFYLCLLLNERRTFEGFLFFFFSKNLKSPNFLFDAMRFVRNSLDEIRALLRHSMISCRADSTFTLSYVDCFLL
jgi:hypothetical protein